MLTDDIAVLVPANDDRAAAALSDVPGVRAIPYRLDGSLPEDAPQARVLVPGGGQVFGFVDPARGAQLVAELPQLEYVQLLIAGAESWVGRLPEHVLLSTCRGAHGGSTAELVVGALLAIYRDFGRFAQAQQERRWDFHRTDTLQGKRVLVVGAGDLGEQLTRRLVPFDAEVTLVGRTRRDGVHDEAQLPELLGAHDAVVLVVPLTEATAGMVDAAFLGRMPDGAVLVNAARGRVVDTDALLSELASGRLRAVLDVTDPEPLPPQHPLWTAPGLLLFPHIGGSCHGLEERAWRVAAAEIARFAAGEQPRNLVRGEY